ncbi:capsular biosynthesis protein, partial [Campylobacter jejuni]|nr:capsular biosynthesis protein [Campylobacter jejuni]
STRVDVDILLNESCIKNFYEMKFYEICDSHIGDGTGTGCVFGGREAMEKYTSLYCYMDKLKGRFVNYKLDNHEMFFKFNIYKNIKNVFVNLLQINIWGKTRVGNGYYFPNIKNELKMDIEKLENKFSKQEIDSFIKSFSIVEKRFKPMSS